MASGNVTGNNNTDYNDSNYNERVNFACFVVIGIIIPLGFICNTISIVVFFTSKVLKRTSTGNYLLALSAADWLFLVGNFIRWLNSTSKNSQFYLDMNFMHTNNVVCKMTHFIRYCSKLASAWIIVAITTERFVSVRWPLHAHEVSTPARAKIIIAVTYVVCLGLGAFPLWTIHSALYRNTTSIVCIINDEVQYDIWNWVVLRVGSLLLPGFLMCVLTGLIIYSLTKARSTREQRLSCNSDTRRSNHTPNIERQLTVILLAVVVAFIVLRLPYTVFYYVNEIKKKIWQDISDSASDRIYIISKITDVIATANYTVNFFLYCVCGSSFRRQLRALCSCVSCDRHLERASTSSTSRDSRTLLTVMAASSPGKNSSSGRVNV